MWLAKDEADRKAKIALANEYYARFDNVFTGPGQVKNGDIAVLPRKQTIDELAENLLICTENEMIDKLGVYLDAGVDEIISSQNIGTPNAETLENMQRIAESVMPHVSESLRETAG